MNQHPDERHLDAALVVLVSFALVVVTLGVSRIIMGFP